METVQHSDMYTLAHTALLRTRESYIGSNTVTTHTDIEDVSNIFSFLTMLKRLELAGIFSKTSWNLITNFVYQTDKMQSCIIGFLMQFRSNLEILGCRQSDLINLFKSTYDILGSSYFDKDMITVLRDSHVGDIITPNTDSNFNNLAMLGLIYLLRMRVTSALEIYAAPIKNK